ncbi:hypothetical protein GJ744_000865 [Endocarpon pusillum]|uniref:HMG box domain-containing protein n=1 Tax=Endocarpon pusillum TaxID=364733 RepID=A0A8H7E6V8_9EURO|nr:hypothetical protein GJ744_000865 [Endocarpon pusillum]
MARKAQEPDSDTTVVNIADFQRTRDSVIVALATLQNSVQDLSKAYINHANTVLNPGRAGTLDLNLTTTLLDSGLLTHRAPSPGMKPEAPTEAKKKRKRAAHDPNAPKRALTPYFLYMQSARPQIAQELGSNAKPKEVADEGTRRWSIMPDADKNVWNAAYQRNLAVYRVKTAAYKAGKPVPSDEEAEKIAQTDTTIATVPVEEEEEEVEEEPEVVEEESDTESSPEPVREPSPPKSGKRRKTSDKPAATPVKETPKPTAAAEKDKRSKKAKKEPTPPPASKTAEKKKKTRKAA